MKRLKLYIGCGLNGAPTEFVQAVLKLKDSLRTDYDILDFIGLNYSSTVQVYRWDIEYCVRNCDLFVAICDERSTGLGWELSEAIHLGTPVLAVAHKDTKISGIVLGAAAIKPTMTFAHYNNLSQDVPDLIKKQISQLPQPV